MSASTIAAARHDRNPSPPLIYSRQSLSLSDSSVATSSKKKSGIHVVSREVDDMEEHELQNQGASDSRTPSEVEDGAVRKDRFATWQSSWHDPKFEVDWSGEYAKECPRNWSRLYKSYVLITISWSTLMSVVAATAYTSATEVLQEVFDQPNVAIVSLGLTTYLFGWVFGALIFAPLSETYGRRWIYVITKTLSIILLIPTNLANNLPGIIIARLFTAIFCSGVIALSPGTISDIANDEERSICYSIWSIGPFIAPAIGPIFGGYTVQYLGWHWIVWICMCGSGVGTIMLLFVKESYTPVLLRRKAAALRKSTGDDRWWSRYDSTDTVGRKLSVSLRRPFVLAFTEPMLLLWNTYIGLIYGVLYLSFTAYPVVFQQIRGWDHGTTGLSFLGLGVGAAITIAAEPLIRRVIRRLKCDPQTGKPAPEAQISIVCVAAILLPAGEFWFAWSSEPPVHWIVPILAGVPFGAGSTANFIYALNYLAHSYGSMSASVMAGNTFFRCVIGGTLPLAGPVMFDTLGPIWAGSLLAFLLLAMAPIPFVFYRYGAQIRQKSPVIAAARAEESKMTTRSDSDA